ncbi:protocadherin Fat 1/2/3 [Schistosoma japonicum]|nr:protocadherin Fat 1/2/3 [Schistosoma japonicum]
MLQLFSLFDSEVATYSSVYSDDTHTPFSFTSPLYKTILIDDGSSHQYIIPTRHHMGVSEPFSGNPSGDVVFSIIDFDSHIFQTVCKKLGRFFFMHLYASPGSSVNSKKPNYRFNVEAVFTSHNTSSVTPIRLSNTTEVLVNVIARENCPMFTRTFHHFDVPDNTSTHQTIGKLSASISGSITNAQHFFYMDPLERDIPIHVDLYSGDVFLTRPSSSLHSSIGYPGIIHQKSEIDPFGISNYTFNVFIVGRGKRERMLCNMVSATRVEVSIVKSRHSDLSIVVEHLNEIVMPGSAGVVYARVHVVGSPSVGSIVGLRIFGTRYERKVRSCIDPWHKRMAYSG